MASIGKKLRDARLEQGLELSEVSDRTKISKRFLEAIEADDRKTIPGGFFYRSWVQQYARSVSLDVAAITADVDRLLIAEVAPETTLREHSSSKEIRPARIPLGSPSEGSRILYSFGLLLLVVLGCSGLYTWWNRTVQVHANAASTPAARGIASVSKPARAIPVPGHAPPAAATQAPGPAQATAPEASAATDRDVQIEIAATEQTWLSITPDGKQLFSGILQPAEVKTVSAHDGARIRVGNAGGLQVRLNGKPIGPIGPAGTVRLLIINRSGFQIIEPKASAPVGT